jgi:hypothetical protein
MSLDITLTALRPTSVWTENITHNLNTMANAVKVSNTTLYKVLWYPEELGLKTGEDILPYLRVGLSILMTFPEEYKQHNPSNGWGDYYNLVDFVKSYIIACTEFPDGVIEISK